ncbi:MAG: MarR family transcriptional regulator [Armatimonadia bacterium]
MSKESSADSQQALELWLTMLKVFFRLRNSIRPIFAEHGLTGPQWRLFRMLGEAAGEGLTPGQMSEELRVTQGNTTGIVDKLEEAGLVQRKPHPDDRRALLIHLTEQGERLYQEVRPVFDARLTELLGCLPPDCKADMLSSLQQILQHLDDLNMGICQDCGGRCSHDAGK